VLRDPEPQIAVAELADSSVNLVVRPWCKAEDYWPLRFDLTRGIKEELEAAGCSIPFPQHDVHVIPPG
jgi:small conductance mechanosensitive channel